MGFWIGLSIDSISRKTLNILGRTVVGKIPITSDEYLHIISTIKHRDIRLKINTVVTSVTWMGRGFYIFYQFSETGALENLSVSCCAWAE